MTGRRTTFEFVHPTATYDGLAHLYYSTYDFTIGAEYETFATIDDWNLLRTGRMPDSFTLNGRQAFVRFKQGGCFGFCVLKTIVFPFASDYIAVVYNLGEYDFDVTSWETVRESLRAGKYPEEHRDSIAAIDRLAQSLVFRDR